MKHNKYKNTGLIFELLTNRITSDIINGKNSEAINILKKYYSKGEILKEHKLYQKLIQSQALNESKADIMISSVLSLSERINRYKLKQEKYELLREIKEKYGIEEFFSYKVPKYKIYASVYNLFEHHISSKYVNPNEVINNRITLMEHITKPIINKEKIEDKIIEEYCKEDKKTQNILSSMLVEKFNQKYNILTSNQKEILREYITNPGDDTLVKYYNNKISLYKSSLNGITKSLTDNILKVRLNEVLLSMKLINKKEDLTDDKILGLMQIDELIDELHRS